MLKRLLVICTALISVLSVPVTFKNVTIECDTEDQGQITVDIESSKNLSELPSERIFRITIIGDTPIPVIYEDAIANLTSLRILQIRQHQVEKIEAGAFKNLPRLEVLRLNGNKLKEIKDEIFSNLNLVFLNLEYNLIEKISLKAFDNLTKLQALGLEANKLKEFHPEWLKGKPNLSAVSLRYNIIAAIPEGAFENYHNDIDLNNNRIQNLSNGIFGSGKKKLGRLGLGDNAIEIWDESFLKNVKLESLDISNNKLECLNGNLDYFFIAFHTWIDGNPWNCDCLEKIVKWTSKQDVRQVKMKSSLKKCNLTGSG